jgi:hypothetical protein
MSLECGYTHRNNGLAERLTENCVPLLVLPDHDDHKRPRPGCRTTGCSRFLFLKFACGQIHLVPRQVDVHCFGANRSSHGLHYLELAGRTLARNVKLAVTAARKCLLTVEPRRIHASADRRSASTLPSSVLITISFCGFRHPMKSRRFAVSIDNPTGDPPGATGQCAKTFLALMSTTATWSLSSKSM